MQVAIEVGKKYPGAVPMAEGANLEIGPDGLIMLIQMPDCTREEARAFRKGVRRHTYLESSGTTPVAIWAFDFKKPHGPVDTNFNARIVRRDWLDNWMTPEDGQTKNALNIILLDRRTVRGIKLFGLHQEAVGLFHATIRKQLATEYTQADYDSALSGMYAFSTEDFFRMGACFKSKS